MLTDGGHGAAVEYDDENINSININNRITHKNYSLICK
jgi:homoaconitase/3-isopropylmalate dehydratase large subunit